VHQLDQGLRHHRRRRHLGHGGGLRPWQPCEAGRAPVGRAPRAGAPRERAAPEFATVAAAAPGGRSGNSSAWEGELMCRLCRSLAATLRAEWRCICWRVAANHLKQAPEPKSSLNVQG
jgi:hypothetical protein